MDPIATARRCLARQPEGPWRLEPQDDGTFELWGGNPEQLLGRDIEAGLAHFVFDLLIALKPLVLATERAQQQRDAALTHLAPDVRTQITALLAPPEPSPEAAAALDAFYESLEPFRVEDDGDDSDR